MGMMTDERFLRKTLRTETGCLLWTGSNDGTNGYGTVRRNGRLMKAHRYAYEMTHGSIPDGMMVCHTCDVPACVEPTHLFLGTSRDNVVDMIEKGRNGSGRPRRGLKLTVDDVVAIRQRWAAGESQRSLAAKFGIDQSHVSRLVRADRDTWAECPTCHRPL